MKFLIASFVCLIIGMSIGAEFDGNHNNAIWLAFMASLLFSMYEFLKNDD